MSRKNPWMRPALVSMPFPICLCTNASMFWKEMNRMKIPAHCRPDFLSENANATAHFFTNGDGQRCSIVCIKIRNDLKDHFIFGVLAHEATHVWQEACKYIGEDEPSPEFEAYAIQSITHALTESYLQQREGYELQH